MTENTEGMSLPNWKGDLVSHPHAVVRAKSVDDIVAVLTDPEKYPSPVRAIGSNHSTTRCGIADGGTVINMMAMNRIVEIGPDYVTAEAGALYIDVAKELQEHGLQFYVNVELGNLTIGSAACGGTKDASMPGEFGQVCSYAIAMKLVTPAGEILEVTEEDPELLQVMRSSYGLLGIVYEATFKVKPLQAMSVYHVSYRLEEFEQQLPALWEQGESMMLYLFPFLNRVTVEFRKYVSDDSPPNRFIWRFRNYAWKTVGPTYGYVLTKIMPFKGIRFFLIDWFNLVLQKFVHYFLRDRHTVPTDQMILYPERASSSGYTFSIWAFPEENYAQILRDYYAFCRDYYDRTGYRCNMLNVAYRIAEDTSSLFSYSFNGRVMTLDPVSTGDPGWDDFLKAYNEFCSQLDGVPLFNQTKWITPEQAKKAFGDRLVTFRGYRQRFDPNDRLLNPYFKEVLMI
jgi:FAD/FMN-containing dehydrogenase